MKPIASLSLDLDNKWSYMKTHGDDGWEEYPTYLDIAVPRILDFLKKRDLTITFFIVGQDAALEKNFTAIKAIADAGHEIGNHSFNHEPWLHLYSFDKLDEELAKSEEAIESVTGKKPIGFRGPGFSLSENTLRVLSQRGYKYDATVFPNVLNPLARAYMFSTSNLSPEQKEQRKALFGTLDDALRPIKAYKWNLDDNDLIEIPVTTMPVFKIPIHLSYVLFLSRYSSVLAMLYFRFSLLMCKLTRTSPSVLLHPLDFLGIDDAKELQFFPGMNLSVDKKIHIVSKVLKLMADNYTVTTMEEHAKHVAKINNLSVCKPKFRSVT